MAHSRSPLSLLLASLSLASGSPYQWVNPAWVVELHFGEDVEALRLLQVQVSHAGSHQRMQPAAQNDINTSAVSAWQDHRGLMSPSNESGELDLAACETIFSDCWDSQAQEWKVSSTWTTCDDGPACESLLCTSPVEHERCAIDIDLCIDLSSMCLKRNLAPKAQTLSKKEADDIAGKKKPNLVFLHIPKNAGVTMETIGMQYGQHWGINMHKQKLLHPYCMWHHTPPEVLPDPWMYEEADAVFCVVRHPYERAVSEYKYLLGVGWGWLPFSTQGELYDLPPCTPEGLNHFVQTTLRIMRQDNQFLNDCHVLPQVSYIFGRDRQWCTEMLNISSLSSDFNALMHKYSIDARMDGGEQENGGSMRCNITSAAFYPETLQMLDEAYALDFEHLGFARGSVSS